MIGIFAQDSFSNKRYSGKESKDISAPHAYTFPPDREAIPTGLLIAFDRSRGGFHHILENLRP
jgi:hypothetical protein